ncbi:MAG: dephospho-CoA kinase [Sedimentisphaerales bacterium]|nr:dephospho-CoA kinase [Sedimentisphaerales bacterium]
MKNKPIIGLTGGAGAGKTTVARQFEKLGCAVIDADQLNHEVLTNPEIVHQIEQWWGPEVLGAGGLIDREVVGRIVFADENELRKLTNLVHPLISDREQAQMAKFLEDPTVKAVVLDVPLLYETGQDKWCDKIVFVQTESGDRQKRVAKKRGWDEERLKKVEKIQMPLDSKAKRADYVIANKSTISSLETGVTQVLSQILTEFKIIEK